MHERQPAVADRQCHPGAGNRGAGAEPVDHRTSDGCRDDSQAGERANDESGDPEAEAAAVMQVDDLERQDGSPTKRVQEDPDLNGPQLGREPEVEATNAAATGPVATYAPCRWLAHRGLRRAG